MDNDKPSFGVIVARFQVDDLTEAHCRLLDAVGQRHKQVVVFLGTTHTDPTKHDPLSFEVRRAMVAAKYPGYFIYRLMDCKTDEEWSRQLDVEIARSVPYGAVTLYGGRDSFIEHYKGKHRVYSLEFEIPISKSGSEVRAEISQELLASRDFRRGIIYATMNSWPRVIPTVDVAIIHRRMGGGMIDGGPAFTDGIDLLLAKKLNEHKWRFPGGHAEGKSKPQNVSFEDDARMEAMEETNTAPTNLTYVGSIQVDDWRYRNTPEGIKTLLFLGEVPTLETRAADDVCETKFVPIETLNEHSFEPEHVPLWRLLREYLKKTGALHV